VVVIGQVKAASRDHGCEPVQVVGEAGHVIARRPVCRRHPRDDDLWAAEVGEAVRDSRRVHSEVVNGFV
jgi:hypothetical protein